jgi:D-alanine-D-alanine ligase
MEINPLPGLTPGYSDICIQAATEGIDYEDLILEILYLAAGRWGMLEPRVLPPAVPKKRTGTPISK